MHEASDANEIHIPCGIHPQHEHLIEYLFQWLAIPRCEDVGVAYCTSLAGEETPQDLLIRIGPSAAAHQKSTRGRSPGSQESA